MNKRDAINEVLLTLNELPLEVSDLVADIPIAVLVDREIEVAKKKILAYGWNFNTLLLSFYPNNQNNIVVPTTYLSVKPTEDNPNIIIRDWKVFNKVENSFIYTEAVELNVVDDVLFDDIPFPVANYIVQHAGLKAYVDIIADNNGVSLRRQEMLEARMEAFRYDTQVSDTNILSQEYATNLMNMTSL